MNLVKIRGILSSTLIIVFVVVFISGLGLFFAPSGRVANEVGWNFLGLSRAKLENMHNLWGFVMSGLVVVHLLLNYKLLLSEIRSLFKRRK